LKIRLIGQARAAGLLRNRETPPALGLDPAGLSQDGLRLASGAGCGRRVWIGSGPAASVRLLDDLGWNGGRCSPFTSPNTGPRRARSSVRAADPLSPGSIETSHRRSQAGTGTRLSARVRGRRSCLGRPRVPEHARYRASTRGLLRGSTPHRTFPVFEDHHDRGALSPRACDHIRGRGAARGRAQRGRRVRSRSPEVARARLFPVLRNAGLERAAVGRPDARLADELGRVWFFSRLALRLAHRLKVQSPPKAPTARTRRGAEEERSLCGASCLWGWHLAPIERSDL
jgi:hypothetical protein